MISRLPLFFAIAIFLQISILNAQSDILSSVTTVPDSLKIKELYNAAKRYRSRNLDSAELDGKKALNLAKENKLVEWQAKMNSVLGNILQIKGGDINNEKALQYHQESLEIYREIGIPLKTLIALTDLSNTYRKLKDYPNTLKYAIEAKELSKKIGAKNELQKGIAHGTLANIYNDMGLRDSAITNYKKTKLYLSRIESPLQYYIDVNLGIVYSSLEQYDKAEHAYEMAYNGLITTKDTFSIAKISNSVAYVAIKREQYNKAFKYYKKALQIAQSKQLFEIESRALMGLAEVSYDFKKMDSALYYADRAFYLTDSLNFLSEKSEILEFKSMIHKEIGNTKQALELLEQSQILKDSVEKRKKLAESTELLIANQQEENKKETQGLYAQIVQKNYVLVITGFILILMAILGYTFFKRKKEKLKQQVQELEKEQEEKQELRKELNEKKRELTEYAIHNLNIKGKLLEITESKGLQNQIKKIYDGDDWKEFRTRFNAIHPEFYKKITMRHPALTQREINFLALIGIRLSSKEIASLLNITPAGVQKSRYRIRKKMNIVPEQDLWQAIAPFLAEK